MGKQTCIHPVSLNVIRGAAEFGGFMLGKLRQSAFDEPANVAYYKTQISKTPDDILGLNEIRGRLNDLYSNDVLFTNVWVTASGKIYATFITGDFDTPVEPISVETAIKTGLLSVDDEGIPF